LPQCARISVLGPIEVVGSDGCVRTAGDRIRRLLGLLVIERGRAVPIDRLVDIVWTDGRAPGLSAVHSAVTRLRSLVGSECLRLEDHSYLLSVPPESIDAVLFERHVMEAVHSLGNDPQKAIAEAEAALEMWRGEPYGELASEDPFRLEALRLTDLHDAASETVAAAALACDMLERAVLVSRRLTLDLPYRDRSWELLVEALWRSGRRVEALQAVDRCETTMSEAGLRPPSSLTSLVDRAVIRS